MNFKTTYVLIILAVVLVGVFFWAVWSGPSTGGSRYVLPSMHDKANPIDIDDVDRVEIQRHKPDEETIVFEKDADSKKWRITQPREYRADDGAIRDLIREVYNATREKEAERLTDLAKYGLQPPHEVITLQKGERKVSLNVGDNSPGPAEGEGSVVYVTSSDVPKEIMAVRRRDLDRVRQGVNDFRSRELLSPATGDIQAFALSRRDKDKVVKGPVELKKGSDDRWVYVRPDYGDAQAGGADPAAADRPPANVQTVLTELSNLRVESGKDFVKDDASKLGEYHLDPAKDDVLRVEIDRVEEIAKGEGGKRDRKTAKVALLVGVGKKAGDKSDDYYACLDDPKHKDVVKISTKKVERLLKLLDKPDALRDRNLVTVTGQPDAVDVKNSWGTLEFRKASAAGASPGGFPPPSASWKLWRGDKSYKADETTVQSLVSLLTAPNQVESFPDPGTRAQLGLDKPDVVVRVWANSLPADEEKKDDKKDDKKGEKKEEKKEKKPEPKGTAAYTLSFGYRRENSVAVERKRGDEKTGTVVLVPAKVLDQVREGPLAYLDKELQPFNSNRFLADAGVTRLALTRDGVTYEIARDEKAGSPWKIEKPADFAGRTADRAAVEDILRDLNTLRAVKIVDDKVPEAAKLAEWGLKEPKLRAVVTLKQDGKTKTVEYDFGKEADDKSGVYLRAGGQDLIAVVGNQAVNTLKRELQDPTVFTFDPARVKAVKLTGWIELQRKRGLGEPDVLSVARDKNGSDWVVESPKGFKLDSGKLTDFVRELSRLKATKFVAHKAAPSAEQELDVNKGALKVELTVEGEKEPLVLTVGKADGADAYFAVSNRLPGDIFDVHKDLFDKIKEGPGHFSKQ